MQNKQFSSRRAVPTQMFDVHSVATAIPVAQVAQVISSNETTSNPNNHRRLNNHRSPSSTDIDNQNRQHLIKYGFPVGLRDQIVKTLQQFPLRIWVLDNSGSMTQNDGNLFVPSKKRMITCTRWDELQETMKFHLSVAADLQAPCILRLLNPGHDGSQVMTCSDANPELFGAQLHSARATIMQTYPGSGTPLSSHLHQVHDRIQSLAPELRARGQRVCVVLATDGLPTDNPHHVHGGPKAAFRKALNSLRGLPVWVVIRLLTDDEEVVDYWNNLDQQVEVPLDVLDDWEGEAREVGAVNPWINYTQQLHHAREFGLAHPIFDLMDEKAFGASEVTQFIGLLFGQEAMLELPHPGVDLDGFLAGVERLLEHTKPSFNIVSKKFKPLVSVTKLKKHLKKHLKSGQKGECVIL